MDGTDVIGGASVTSAGPEWSVGRIEDFNGDARPDVLWRNYATGQNYLWYMVDWVVSGGIALPSVNDTNWYLED